MSLDAKYIFVYDVQGYFGISPMEKDKTYLNEKYGGSFSNIEHYSIFWDKPKYTLPRNEYDNLMADQILERKDCELWEIIK